MAKPRVFIGSSVEQLQIAYAVQTNLEYEAETTVWTQGVFGLSQYPLDAILRQLDRSDAGIFIFAPDDKIKLREEERAAVRDNVIFEAGLFAGRLGRERTFLISPRKTREAFKIPSDLYGMTVAEFEARKKNEDIRAALGSACNKIRDSLRKIAPPKPKVPLSVVANMHAALKTLTLMTEDHAKLDFASACMDVHRFIQRIFDTLWNDHDVVVSLKVVDEKNPGFLKCIYLKEVTIRRTDLLGNGAPQYIPIKGSVSGDAFNTVKPQFVADVADDRDRFDDELFEYVNDKISCIVAWPLILDGKPIGVLKVDSPTANLFSVDDALFVRIMQFASTQLEMAFKIWLLHSQEARPLPRKTGAPRKTATKAKASKKRKSPTKR